jgi:hypothetical protein
VFKTKKNIVMEKEVLKKSHCEWLDNFLTELREEDEVEKAVSYFENGKTLKTKDYSVEIKGESIYLKVRGTIVNKRDFKN